MAVRASKTLLIGYVLLAAASVLGQQQFSVDPLLITELWQPVIAKDCNAQFRMPRGHKSESSVIDANGRKLLNYSYTWSSSNGQLSVSCGAHPFFVDDVDTLRGLYDTDLTSPFRIATSENIVYSDMVVAGHPARQVELTRLNGKVYIKVWVMLVGGIRFQITFGTYKAPASPKPNAETSSSIDTFFNSVSFTQRMPAISRSYDTSLPPGYLGTMEARKYTNKALGFTVDLPADWSEPPNQSVQEYVADLFGNSERQDLRRARFILYSSKGLSREMTFPSFMIILEKQVFVDVSPKNLAEANKTNLANDNTITLAGDVGEETIGGRSFAKLAVEKSVLGGKLNQLSYFHTVGAYTLTFNLQYVNDTSQQELLKIMRSVRFMDSK